MDDSWRFLKRLINTCESLASVDKLESCQIYLATQDCQNMNIIIKGSKNVSHKNK